MRYRLFPLLGCVAMQTVLAQSPAGLSDVLAQVAKYEYGQSREPLSKLSELVRGSLSAPSQARAVEEALDKFLESRSTRDGKEAVCRELSVVGSERSVPVLARLLRQPDLAEMARYGLDRIGGPAADAALVDALPGAEGKMGIGIVNTLGRHRAAEAAIELTPMLASPDVELAAAAAGALAAIANSPARAALVAALDKAPEPQRAGLSEAALRCAEKLLESGDRSGAIALYERVYRLGQPEMTRVAALLGLARASGEGTLPLLSTAVKSGSPQLSAAAIRSMLAIPGPAATSAMVDAVPKLPAAGQVRMIEALGDRGDRAARLVVDSALQSPLVEVRTAALHALRTLGDASCVAPVAERAAAATGEEQDAARQCLYGLQGRAVDSAIVESIPGAVPKVRVELIRAAAERNLAAAADVLLAAAKDEDAVVRREAFRALRDTATPERLPALIGLLMTARGNTDLTEAQRAVSAAVKRAPRSCGPELTAAYRSATEPAKRAALLLVMGQAGIAETLPLFREALSQPNEDSRRAAILGLSQWPTAGPAGELLAAAGQPGAPALQILALRGYIQLVAQDADRKPADTARMLEKALRLAQQPEEKRAILAVLQKAPSEESLRLAREMLGDASVAAEAKIAVGAIEQALHEK